MAARFTKRQFKRLILQVYAGQPPYHHEHKINVVGRAFSGGQGRLDLHVRDLTPEERVLAGNAHDELRADGLIAPSYHALNDVDNWCWITEKGRALLGRNLLDELDEALAEIDPQLIDLRDGAHDAMRSFSPDSPRQAAASARDLLDQVLQRLAPIEEVRAQPWWDHASDAQSGVTRQQRVRLLLQKRGRLTLELSDAQAEYLSHVWDRVRVAARDLDAMRHKRGSTVALSAEDAVHDCEIALKELLLGEP